MKNKIILLALLAACFSLRAQTIEVSGNQTGIWDADTVLVTGNVSVKDSVVVLPGTMVLFDGYYAIEVEKGASFKAQGTSTDSIVFTVADTTGFHAFDSGLGGWNGFKLDKAGIFLLDYCVLEYGKAVDSLDPFGGAMDVLKSEEVYVRHSTFQHNAAFKRGGAVNGIYSRVEMEACSLHHNQLFDSIDYYIYGGAASFLNCDVDLCEMDFHDNQGFCTGGALSFDSCSVVLDRAVFTRNQGVNGGGLYLMRSFNRECKLSNLLFDNNSSVHFGGGFAVSDGSPEISNVLVINNDSYGVSCAGIFFYQECSAKLNNCIIYGNYHDPESAHTDTTQMWMWTFEGYGPEFRNCLVEGGEKYIHSPEAIALFENILDTDPMFVDAENHDFHLAPDSPCIDAGDMSTPSYVLNGLDLDGMPRVFGQRVDIGPYEFGSNGVSSHPTAPLAKLFGNPLGAQSRIELETALEGTVTVSVYSMVGRCVASKVQHLDGMRSLEIGDLVENLVPGVYLVEIRDRNSMHTFKAVR